VTPDVKSPLPNRTAVVVLGMHRSGTSALTRVLTLLGCHQPKTLMAGKADNVDGHWESNAVMRVNRNLLHALDSEWSDWQSLKLTSLHSTKLDIHQKAAQKVIIQEFGDAALFALKDPRIARMFPFWQQVLGQMSIKPVAVLPLRNPIEVAASLQKRNGIEQFTGLLLWLRHVLDAEHSTRGVPRIFTNYNGLLTDWRALARAAEPALGLKWPNSLESIAPSVDSYLSAGSRHHHALTTQLEDLPYFADWLSRSFGILESWANTSGNSADFASLDQIHLEFNAAARPFAQLVDLAEAAVKHNRALINPEK